MKPGSRRRSHAPMTVTGAGKKSNGTAMTNADASRSSRLVSIAPLLGPRKLESVVGSPLDAVDVAVVALQSFRPLDPDGMREPKTWS